MFKIKSPETWQFQERTVSLLEQMQVQIGTVPGVRRSKRHLFASRKPLQMVYWNLSEFGNKVTVGIWSTSVTRSRFSEMSYQWRVSLYMVKANDVM